VIFDLDFGKDKWIGSVRKLTLLNVP